MALMFNNKKTENLFYNSKKVCSIYYGGSQVFKCSSPPTVDNNTATLSSLSRSFKVTDFTKNFTDPDGDSYKYLNILSRPSIGTLTYLGNLVKGDLKILVSNSSGLVFNLGDNYAIYNGDTYKFDDSLDNIITSYNNLGYELFENSSGKLIFKKPGNPLDSITVIGTFIENLKYTLNFSVTDDSSNESESNVAKFTLVPSGNVNLKEVYVNTPPTVGDNTVSVNRESILTLNREVFLKYYSDTEGDAAYELRVDSLPTNGTLYLRGSLVSVGQILSFKDDIDKGGFTFEPGTDRRETSANFSFSVSDTGSKTFG